MDKKRILIVEDEGIQAMGLEETLERAGYEVIGIADNGLEALDKVRSDAPDLVLLDIHIKGDMDGIATAWKIRDISPAPIIYLTAYVDPETIRRAEETSPAAYITKPYRQPHLLKCVEEAVGGPEND